MSGCAATIQDLMMFGIAGRNPAVTDNVDQGVRAVAADLGDARDLVSLLIDDPQPRTSRARLVA